MSRRLLAVFVVALGVGLVVAAWQAGFAQQPAQQAAQQPTAYLLIEKFEIAPGRAISEATEEMSGIVRELRKTGEFNSVRLYTHNYGPELAVYIITEPKSWQALKNGADKLFAARPDLLTTPFRWAGHSDNILAEIPVR